jgi:hypothetical protein
MTATVLDNLILPAPSGLSSGQVEGWNWGNSDSSAYIDHNGSYATPYGSWFPFLNHTGQPASTTTILKSLRANIGFSPGANSSNIALNSWQGGGTTAEVQSTSNNNVVVAQEGWNGWYNAASDNTFNSTLADTNCNPSTSSNTPYQQCTVSGTPGTHDVVGNPNLIDRSRGMRTWASIKHGQAATVAGVQAAFQGCQNLQACIMELEAWVRQGYQPTNLAYKGAAHDGGVVGVSGTPGSGYSGACSASVTVQDANDLGTGAALSCSFVGGIPVVTVVNPGMHYRVATPATVTINGTGGSGAALNVMVSPSDIGPVPITLFAGVAP